MLMWASVCACSTHIYDLLLVIHMHKYHAPVTNLVPPRFAVFALEKYLEVGHVGHPHTPKSNKLSSPGVLPGGPSRGRESSIGSMTLGYTI